jgi:hypothetical protein
MFAMLSDFHIQNSIDFLIGCRASHRVEVRAVERDLVESIQQFALREEREASKRINDCCIPLIWSEPCHIVRGGEVAQGKPEVNARGARGRWSHDSASDPLGVFGAGAQSKRAPGTP